LAAPLTDLVKKKSLKIVKWGPEQEKTFTFLKDKLCSYPVRYMKDYRLPFLVQTDASERGIGAVLDS
ncbi:hypothetical protein JRQ81_003550, partial [Phrynocephalus forsythii]